MEASTDAGLAWNVNQSGNKAPTRGAETTWRHFCCGRRFCYVIASSIKEIKPHESRNNGYWTRTKKQYIGK